MFSCFEWDMNLKRTSNGQLNYRNFFISFVQVLAEYVGGGDLGLHLRNGGLPLAQLREYTRQVVEALCYLHGKAVVHKDLRVSALYMRFLQIVLGAQTQCFEICLGTYKNSSLLR